jgi:transcriptional regulator with XRE-family HTH domain
MVTAVPSLTFLDQRRKSLQISRAALARRAGVSLPTVNRILSGQEAAPSITSLHALAAAMGLQVRLGHEPTVEVMVDAREFRRQQAVAKAKRLVALVQGTMGLEAAAVDRQTAEELLNDNVDALLAGSSRRLWDE